MAIRVAINGFGRIGRMVFRAAMESNRTDLEFVAINDLGSPKANAHLLKYDSVHGRLNQDVSVDGDTIRVGDRAVKVYAERDPKNLPWGELGIDVVMECTGIFTKREQAAMHLEAGAKKVLISAPATGADLTVVYGVNHDKIAPEHTVISNASCTTNCLAPVAHVLNQAIGIERGYMTTIHAYTGDQKLHDNLHSDMRRARAGALSLIPTSTGAARAVGEVLPELKGKLDGTAIRVPTANVSVVDLKFVPSRATTVDEINDAIRNAASNQLAGVLGVNDEELVSCDFNHNTYSSVFDLTQTQTVEGTLVRVLSWYDNEWGFSNRMLDTAAVYGRA
ncbi:MAG: type I glyceraldehyde-3-phosphate dehydrogenase [Alphaproteobacteria bacterium]|nr:type I glyceraldehyde-3-phosphate dehydrogenase [Alphaproteobacteria bacterium]